MHIDISHILASEVGARISFEIAGERPKLSDILLTSDVDGNVRLMRTELGLISGGKVRTSFELDCHRCLSTFSYPATVELTGEFVTVPEPDQWPISPDHQIDLAQLLRQELLLAAPIKQLCRPDCLGLCVICGQSQTTPHDHNQPKSETQLANALNAKLLKVKSEK